MSTGEPLTPRNRDAALQKLRDWRTTIAIGSAGAVVAFGVVAAVTIPGQASASTGGTTQPPASTGDTQSQPENGDGTQVPVDPNSGAGSTLQAPQQLPAFGFGGGGRAVSGGSH